MYSAHSINCDDENSELVSIIKWSWSASSSADPGPFSISFTKTIHVTFSLQTLFVLQQATEQMQTTYIKQHITGDNINIKGRGTVGVRRSYPSVYHCTRTQKIRNGSCQMDQEKCWRTGLTFSTLFNISYIVSLWRVLECWRSRN